MKKLALLLLVALSIVSCRTTMEDCDLFKVPNMETHHYKSDIEIDAHTPMGIPVDTGGVSRDLSYLDTMAMEVKACLDKNFPDHVIPQEVLDKTYCKTTNFTATCKTAYDFGCWQVKIDNNWKLSCWGTDQMLSATTGAPTGWTCGGKNMVITEECPCHYRVAVDGKTIVVTPDARLFKDGLVRTITGCENPWAHPLLSECAKPSEAGKGQK